MLFDYVKKHRVYIVYIPLFAYWSLMLILTSLPGDSLPSVEVSDKLSHLLAYFGLGFLLNLWFRLQEKNQWVKSKHNILAYIVLMIYGAIDEIHQYFIPGRYCEFLDWIANIVGGLLGIVVVNLLIKIDEKVFK